MAKPKSPDRRDAILEATTRVIVLKGLSASTAAIAKEAGVSNGSLFTYFETKTDLFNQLYLDLKIEMATTALKGFPVKADLRAQMFHVWSNWMNWAASAPEKRRAIAQLSVFDQISPETRAAAQKVMGSLVDLVDRARAAGSLSEAPLNFVGAIMHSFGEATMDFMIQNPARAKEHCKLGFETFWRAIS